MTDNNENNTTSPDESTDHTPAFFGQAGTGKTHQIGAELARRLTDEAETTEWIDSKGEGMSEGEGEENAG